MTTRPDPDDLLPRRVLTAAIVALALAASAYLTQEVGAAHPPSALLDADVLGEPAAAAVVQVGDGSDPSVPPAARVFERSIATGVDDTPPPSF